MNNSTRFENILAEAKKDQVGCVQTAHSSNIASLINHYMSQNKIDEKTMANKLKTTPRKLSYWTSGSHNFSLIEISKIEVALKIELIPFLQINSMKELLKDQ